MRLLIFDDEKLIRNGIKSLVTKMDLGFNEIRVCENGFQALEIAETFMPEVIIADILMPEINGIETIEQIYQILPKVQIIIISGCNDFSYVRSSLCYPVVDYLPKPINKNELVAALHRAIRQLESVQAKEDSVLRSERILSMLDQMKEQFLCSILTGRYSPDAATFQPSLTQFDLNGLLNKKLIVAVIALKNENHRLLPTSDFAVLQRYMENCFKSAWYIPIDETQFALLYSVESSSSEFVEDMKKALDNLRKKELINAVAGVSTVFENLTDMHIAYQTACNAMLTAQMGNDSVVLGGDIQMSDSPQKFYVSDITENKLRACVSSGDSDNLHKIIQENIALCSESVTADTLWHIKLEYVRIYVKLLHLLESPSQATMLAEINEVYHLTDAKHVAAWLERHLLSLANLSNSMRISRAERVCQYIQKEIAARYGECLSLQTFSDETGLSTNYLSQIFIKCVGVSFISYLTNLRMTNALELLRTTNMPISSISQHVGYDDPNYFTRIFKKIYNVSPTEFRGKV